MRASRRLKVLLSVSLVFLVAVLTLGYTSFFREDVQEDLGEDVLGLRSDVSGVPYITSLPPIVAVEGELYEYFVTLTHRDLDNEDLTLEYVEGPFWLNLEDTVLRGIPPTGSAGSYKIVLRVSDGYNSSSQEEYILVEESLE